MDCKSKNNSNKKLVQGKLLYIDTNVIMLQSFVNFHVSKTNDIAAIMRY